MSPMKSTFTRVNCKRRPPSGKCFAGCFQTSGAS
jgi:hypothetical protein